MDSKESETKWFMQYQGQVQGPYKTSSLQAALERMENQSLDQALVWRRGLAEWMKASKWQPDLEIPAVAVQPQQATRTVNISDVATSAQTMASTQIGTKPPSLDETQTQQANAFYRVQVNFVDQPMMTKNELMTLISKQDDISTVAVQDPKSKEWKEVYAFPDIVEKLGLSRRKHPRVPILAQFAGKTNRHENFFARIITLSEGGAGLTEVFDLKIGDELEGQITSPHFFQPINIRADVVYAGTDGYIGLKFNQINDESQAAVIDYIKKFGKGSEPS